MRLFTLLFSIVVLITSLTAAPTPASKQRAKAGATQSKVKQQSRQTQGKNQPQTTNNKQQTTTTTHTSAKWQASPYEASTYASQF